MAKKFKINRSFTYKAYVVSVNENNEEVRNFLYKSECHYYVEKHILDALNSGEYNCDNCHYEIINVTTVEDSKRENYLIETISVADGKIYIKAPNEI